MSKRWQYAIDGLLLGFIGAMAYDAAGQTLQPVDTGGGFSLWIVLILGVVIVAIAGLIIWHKRNPSGQTKALMDAHTAMTSVATAAHDALHALGPRIDALGATINGGLIATPAQPNMPAIDDDKLAAVEAARVAYENAKADAGIP